MPDQEKIVQLPDGRLVSFPATMGDDQISTAIRQESAPAAPPGGLIGFGEELNRTLTGRRNLGEMWEGVKQIGARLERARTDPRGGGLFGVASDLIGSIIESEQARAASAAEEPDFAKRVVKNIPFVGGRLGEAGEMLERKEYARGTGATVGIPLLLAPRPITAAAASATQATIRAAPTAARIALKPVQAPLQALYQTFGDVRKRPGRRLVLERAEAAGVKKAIRAVDQGMEVGFRELETAIPGSVTDTVKFRNILNDSAAEFSLDPRALPAPKTLTLLESTTGSVDFNSARRALREMYRDAHRGAVDRQVRAASARASERIMDEVLQPAADAVSPEMGKFYSDMRRSYSEYARDFLNKDSVGADLLDVIEEVKRGSTRPMLALFQDPTRGVQVRALLRKYEISAAPMDEIIQSTLAESRMPLTWDDATRLMSERGAKGARLQEISAIQQRLGGGEAIRPGFTQYAAGVAQLIASIPLRYVPGFRQFLLWGESDIAPTVGRTFRVPAAPPSTSLPPLAAPSALTPPSPVAPATSLTPVPQVPPEMQAFVSSVSRKIMPGEPSAAVPALLQLPRTPESQVQRAPSPSEPSTPPAAPKGKALVSAATVQLQDQLALSQFGKRYGRLASDEQALIDKLIADIAQSPVEPQVPPTLVQHRLEPRKVASIPAAPVSRPTSLQAQESAPHRTLNIGRGMNPQVRVEFPDRLHANLYSLPGRFRRRTAGQAGEWSPNAIAEKLGVSYKDVWAIADEYKARINTAIKNWDELEIFKAPRYKE